MGAAVMQSSKQRAGSRITATRWVGWSVPQLRLPHVATACSVGQHCVTAVI